MFNMTINYTQKKLSYRLSKITLFGTTEIFKFRFI